MELARHHDLDPAQMAIAFVRAQPFTAASIIGATSMEQLATNISAYELQLSDRLLDEIDEIHHRLPNPAP